MTSSDIDAYNLQNSNKEEILNTFNSKELSGGKIKNTISDKNIKKEKSLRNSELGIGGNNKNNGVVEMNAINLMEEMRNNNNDFNNNNQNQYEEDCYQGNDQINFVQNLSEYNLSNYNSNKQNKDLKNNFQFAKTIIQIDDDLKKDRYKDKKNVENFGINLEDNKTFSRNRSKIAFSVNSNSSNTNNLVAFLFINPNSGIQSGSKILGMGVQKVEFNDTDGMVYIYNLNDNDNLNAGINKLKNQMEKGNIKFF